MSMNMSSFLQKPMNLFVYRILGWRLTFYYITLLGKIYFFLNGKEKEVVHQAVGSVFGGDSRQNLSRLIFKGILFHYYEKLFNAFSSSKTLGTFFNTHVEATGLSDIQKALSKGRGALLITGHFGGVEFVPAYVGNSGIPVAIVAKFSSEKLRKRSVEKGREFNAKIIDPDKTPNVLKEMMKCLKENRVVITQCDEIEEWRPAPNRRCRFLGQDVPLDRSMSLIIQRAKVPTFFCVMQRDARMQRYRFEVTPLDIAEKGPASVALESHGEMLLKILERYIYRFPEEWYQWKKLSTLPAFDPMLPEPIQTRLEPALAAG